MKTEALIALMEDLAPGSLAAPWDNCGVQIAGEAPDVHRLAVALDPRPQTVKDCLEWGASFILTHHPLYLKPQAPAAPGGYLDVLRLVLRAGAWLYAAHTSLDAAPDGPAFWLGRELGLSGRRVLEPVTGLAEGHGFSRTPGFGEVGDLPEPLTVPALAARLRELTGRSVIQIIGPAPALVRRLAYCAGSGGELIPLAARLGADAYVTGDVKYHQALEAPGLVLDVGHFSLEEEMVRRLALTLHERLEPRGVAVRFFPGEDPYLAYPGPAPSGLPA